MTTTPGLFALHDANAVALPREIVQLREAHTLAQDHLRALTTPAHYLRALEGVTDATVAAFLTGEPVPDIAPVLDAERESRAFEHRFEVAGNAAAALERRTAQALAESADEIITQTLRPVFNSTVAEMQEAYRLLEPFETAGRGALALASVKVRKAAATVDEHSHTYSALRTAAAEVRALQPAPEYDADREFAALKDIHTVWPRGRRTNLGAMPAPWTDAPDVLAWQLRHLTPWLPTVDEQDAEWLKVYGEAMRAQQIRAEQSRAMASTFGAG